jgi:HK97 gp10 family phage protein
MSVKISITGIKEIDNVLRNLPKEITHQVLSSAHSAAAKPLVQRMQLTAPEGPTGNLVDSIGIVRSSVKKADNLGEIKVGPRQRGKYKGFHGKFKEYGFKTRLKPGNKGKSRVAPDKFVEPAFNQTKRIVENGIATQVGRALARKMKQLLK